MRCVRAVQTVYLVHICFNIRYGLITDVVVYVDIGTDVFFETDDGWLESFGKCTQCKVTLPLFDRTGPNPGDYICV